MASDAPAAPPAKPTEQDPRPVVRRPPAGLPGAAIAVLAAGLALILFVALDGHRRHRRPRETSNAVSAFPEPPPLIIPSEPQPQPPVAPVVVTTALPTPAPEPVVHATNMLPFSIRQNPAAPMIMPGQPNMPVPSARYSAPALVLDTGQGTEGGPGSGQGAGGQMASGEDTPIRATVIQNRTTVMPVGTVIPAVLETPIDSTRPGVVRAIVSEDTRGFDGRRVLVPRGSRLIGEYQSDVRSGQNRVLVTWTRLLRPDGVAIRIGSPAADALGGAGVPGHVNNFFFQRFASAVLQSALTVGVNLASRPGNGSVIVGLPTNTVGTIGQDILPGSDLKPKIKVRQGAMLDVFVAHDLDFSGTPAWPHGESR